MQEDWKYTGDVPMVRGVNKQIIEIVNTGSEPFERAILFVRADSAAKDSDSVARQAGEYVSGLRVRRWWFPRRRMLLRALSLLGAAAVGGALAVFFL
jgi:hypothetical protein